MKIKFTDLHNQVLPNIEINFIVNDQPEVYVSDSEGIVEFFEAKEGQKVTCYINEDDKHNFKYKEGNVPEIELEAPVIDMVFITVSDEEESVIGATVYFEYLDKNVEKVSDNTGQIILKGIPINTDVKVYQLDKGREVNVEINKCRYDKAQYFISVDEYFDYTSMKFKLVDKNGQIIRGADVRFKVGGDEFESITNQDGCIVIDEIKVGGFVECKQMIFGKSLPWHKFKCEANIDEYILHGEKPQLHEQSSEKYDSQVRMKFKLVNSKSLPIPNAVLRLEYGDNVRNRYTNQFGEAMVDDVLIGDKVFAYVDLRGIKVSAEFICQEDGEMHEIVLKTGNPKLFLWLIPIAIFIGLGILYTNTDFSTKQSDDDKPDVKQKKDTLIIKNYFFQVNEKNTEEPIVGSRIKLIYNDTVLEQYAGDDGMAKFGALENKLPVKYEVDKLGYSSISQDYSLDSMFTLHMVKIDSIAIAEETLFCGTTFQSPGDKIYYQSFKMNIPKGQFKIWINLFGIPSKVDIYNGSAKMAFKENLVYSTNDFKKGKIYPAVTFDSRDSLITVGVTTKGVATWVYKVYCAHPVATSVQ